MVHLPNPGLGSHQAASEQALHERQQQDDNGQRDDGSRDGSREKYGPVIRKTDHRVHERLFGNRTEDDAEHERRDWKFQTFESVAENAEAYDQPEVRDVVADRKGADEAENQHVSRNDRLGEIENLDERTDCEIAERAHEREAEEKRSKHG